MSMEIPDSSRTYFYVPTDPEMWNGSFAGVHVTVPEFLTVPRSRSSWVQYLQQELKEELRDTAELLPLQENLFVLSAKYFTLMESLQLPVNAFSWQEVAESEPEEELWVTARTDAFMAELISNMFATFNLWMQNRSIPRCQLQSIYFLLGSEAEPNINLARLMPEGPEVIDAAVSWLTGGSVGYYEPSVYKTHTELQIFKNKVEQFIAAHSWVQHE